MRCYKVVEGGKVRRWAGSMADCRASKKELVDEGLKSSAISYEETEVATDKAGLLEFLNTFCIVKG